MLCVCGIFTDKRISHRRAASKSTREAGPKAEIIKLLEAKGIRHFRMNSGDIVVQVGSRKRRIIGNKPGTPDLLVFRHSCIGVCQIGRDWCSQHTHVAWLEVKKSDGKPSKEQIAFQEQAEALGETYLICRSASELEDWLKSNT